MVNKLAQCKKLIAESEKEFSRPTISHYRDKENGMKKAVNPQMESQYVYAIQNDIAYLASLNDKTKKAEIKKLINLLLQQKDAFSTKQKLYLRKIREDISKPSYNNFLHLSVTFLPYLKTAKNPSTKTTIKKTFTKKTVTRNSIYGELIRDAKIKLAKLQTQLKNTSRSETGKRENLRVGIETLKGSIAQYQAMSKNPSPIARKSVNPKTATKTRANYSDFDFDFDKQFGKLSKMFQGKVNGEQRNILASDLQPNKTVRIGELKKLIINGLDGKQYEINFDGEAFASMDRRKGLWFSGKDSRLQLRHNNIKNDEMRCLGHLAQINYVTKKAHIENGKIVEYYHKFGEVNREKPTLWVDSDGFLIVNGGDYDVWKEGIVN